MRKIPAVAVNHFYSACGAPHFSGKSLLMLLKKNYYVLQFICTYMQYVYII